MQLDIITTPAVVRHQLRQEATQVALYLSCDILLCGVLWDGCYGMRGRRRDGGPEGTGRVRPVDCKVERVKLCCNTQHTDGFPNNECGGCSPSWNQSFEIASEAPPGGKEGGTGSAEGNGVHVVAFCQDTKAGTTVQQEDFKSKLSVPRCVTSNSRPGHLYLPP